MFQLYQRSTIKRQPKKSISVFLNLITKTGEFFNFNFNSFLIFFSPAHFFTLNRIKNDYQRRSRQLDVELLCLGAERKYDGET